MNQVLIPKSTRQTIRNQADNLWGNSYRVELITGDGLFKVFNLNRPQSSYVVETRDGVKTCECPSFNRWGLCKHERGLVLLIQSQMSSYYLRHQQALQQAKRMRGEALVHITAYADRLDNAAFELECALGDLIGSGEFYMPRRLVGYVAEAEEGRKAA